MTTELKCCDTIGHRRVRCDACGQYVRLGAKGVTHVMTTPDNAFSGETWETLCARC